MKTYTEFTAEHPGKFFLKSCLGYIDNRHCCCVRVYNSAADLRADIDTSRVIDCDTVIDDQENDYVPYFFCDQLTEAERKAVDVAMTAAYQALRDRDFWVRFDANAQIVADMMAKWILSASRRESR